MKPIEIIPGVILHIESVKNQYESTWYDTIFYLLILDERIDLTKKQTHKLLVKSLPENQLVYSVNPAVGDFLYESEYPEWSIKIHPSMFVAGNIYFKTKEEAEESLKEAIYAKLLKMQQEVNRFREKFKIDKE